MSVVVGQQTTTCYSNGVKDQSSTTASAVTAVVKDAKGNVCRTRTVNTSGEDLQTPDGTLVAHVAYGSNQAFTVTCHAADGTTQVTMGNFQSPECAAVLQQSQQVCTSGDCAW